MRSTLNIPIGRVELLGQVLHIVEHDGRLLAASTDESGKPTTALRSGEVSAVACHDLMRDAVDWLFTAVNAAMNGNHPEI